MLSITTAKTVPSTRLLARMLSVSRNTVLVAYESLAADELIHNLHGSGARVTNCSPLALPPMTSLLSAAKYPNLVTLFADCPSRKSDGDALSHATSSPVTGATARHHDSSEWRVCRSGVSGR